MASPSSKAKMLEPRSRWRSSATCSPTTRTRPRRSSRWPSTSPRASASTATTWPAWSRRVLVHHSLERSAAARRSEGPPQTIGRWQQPRSWQQLCCSRLRQPPEQVNSLHGRSIQNSSPPMHGLHRRRCGGCVWCGSSVLRVFWRNCLTTLAHSFSGLSNLLRCGCVVLSVALCL